MKTLCERSGSQRRARLEFDDLDELAAHLHPDNPKLHDLPAIDSSVERFGYVDPVIRNDRDGRMVSGEGRVRTLLALRANGAPPPAGIELSPSGKWLVPTIHGIDLSPDDARAFLIAANRTVELGGWDESRLAELLSELLVSETGLDAIGFNEADLTDLLTSLGADPSRDWEDPDDAPDLPAEGDVYVEPGASPVARTTQALYDHVVTTLLSGGKPTTGFGLAFVQSVAQESFKQIDGLWYRRGDRVQSERLLTHIADETSAIAWLDRYLGARPATEAEIIPEFNTASTSTHIQGGLSRLLQENFVLDPVTKRWRVPTALERDTLNDAGTEQRRKRVRRVAGGGGEDLTAEELLELAEEAARLELYQEAGEIAAHVHIPDLEAVERERLAMVQAVIEAHVTDGE